ncbi:ferritin-like domain-containing protein [Mycena vitilis]|nr:ferritin-like domain-containing protein [Mycena vitilis]
MKSFFTISVLAAATTNALVLRGMPIRRDDTTTIDDTTILNYALTLEHLENAFYSGALANFTDADFVKAGLPASARGRFVQVGEHEKMHVEFLSTALGANATQPCNYSFPYTDPKSFAALSQVLEGVGVSAYIGAAKYITTPAYLEAAASVLATEARHASYVASAVNGVSGWSGAFDIPLDFNQVYSLAAAFITSCPSTNPALPFKPFPALNITSDAAAILPGSNVTVSYTPTEVVADGTPLCLAFYTGLDTKFAPLADNQTTVPANLTGQVYAVVSSNCTAVDDSSILAGPHIFEFNFDSKGKYE